ncbi:MAG: FadR/GntR family transcriptional regulator [Streptosporangiales bacterium]
MAGKSGSMWSSLDVTPVGDRISRQILDLIAADRLRPGDRLPPERDLAELLGVSRPSLREAVRSLRAQGIVHVRHGAGVFVAEPSMTATLRQALADDEVDLGDLFDMREIIELPAAAWAARRATADHLETVRRAYEELQEASRADRVELGRLRVLDMAFHMRIVEAAGNPFLTRTLGVLQEILARSMETTLEIPGRLERSRTDHTRIFAAITGGEPVKARRAARTHIAGARAAALRRVREQQKPGP